MKYQALVADVEGAPDGYTDVGQALVHFKGEDLGKPLHPVCGGGDLALRPML